MPDYHFGNLIFDETLVSARDHEGAELTFTRAERALLSVLISHPRRVLSRNALLDAMSGIGSDASDRNVDFVINRLRAKLRDPARSPRFIATRYGEGYVWVAEPARTADVLLVVGPVHGLARTGARQPLAKALLAEFVEQFDAATSFEQKVRFDEWFAPGSSPTKAQFSLEISLFPTPQALHCAMVLRQLPGGNIIGSARPVVTQPADVKDMVARAVQQFRSQIWHRHAFSMVDMPSPAAPPLYVAMHDAARLITASTRSWLESIEQVRATLTANPNDPQARLMLGLGLYAHILMGTEGQILPEAERMRIEDEIEASAFAALPGIANNPMLKLSAAKLLLFVARGYTAMAERMAEEAFESTTGFAASFAILGQARMMRGRLAEGIDLLERGLEMAERGSEFAIYIMVLLCGGKLAAEDYAGLASLLAELHEISPVTRISVAPYCVLAHEPLSAQNLAILSAMGEDVARRSLEYIYMTSARQYEHPIYQRNVLRGLAHHLVKLYGPGVVPGYIGTILNPAARG